MSIFWCCGRLPNLYSFPTRRSSDLYDNPNALRDYFRDIGRMVLAAEGRKANDSHDQYRSEERFSRNAETDLVCRLLLDKKTTLTHASTRPVVVPHFTQDRLLPRVLH